MIYEIKHRFTGGIISEIRRDGSVGCGPFLVKIRKRLYQALKDTETRTGWTLITPEEERIIFEHWAKDADVHNKADQSQMMMWSIG